MATPLSESMLSGTTARQPDPIPKARATTRPPSVPDDPAPWTASRCLRILRRLESRLVLLRKLVNVPENLQRAPECTAERNAKRPSAHDNKDDKQQQRKRPRNTYGGRNKKQRTEPKQHHQHHQHGTSPRSVRTLRAMKSRSCSIQTAQTGFPSRICPTTLEGETVAFATTKQQTRRFPESPLDQQHERHSEGNRLYTDVDAWLQALLLSTQVGKGEPHRKSLFGMCLRRIPACIDDIEAWDKAMAQDQAPNSFHQISDAALDIYSQLEGFGAAGLGWRPIKQTLRAHGLWTLKKAMGEGLFRAPQTTQLVRSCLEFGRADEAFHLATSTNAKLPMPRSENSSLDEHASLAPLHTLLAAAARGNRDMHLGPVFDGVSRLIKEKQLPAAWLSTQGLSTLLAAATEAIGDNEGSTAAFGLITVATQALCGDENRKTWHDAGTRLQTVTRIAATLVSTIGLDGSERARTAVTRVSFALDCCINEVRAQKGGVCRGHGLFILSVARFLAHLENGSNGECGKHEAGHSIEALDIHADGTHTLSSRHYRQVMDLVCYIAQGSSQRSLLAAHESLMELCGRLEELPWPTWVLGGLQRDGAFVLAQRTNDLRDLAFAEGQVPHKQSPTPGRAKTMFSGWYWEEAIGEFVVRSPGPNKEESGSCDTARPRLRSQTRHHPPGPPQSPYLASLGQADESDSDVGLDLRTTKNGTRDDSEQIGNVIISASPAEEAPAMTSDEEEGEDRDDILEQDSRVYARLEPETTDQGSLQGRGALKGRMQMQRQMSGNGRNGLSLGSASPAPIGGARQLFIVRGPGRRSAGEEADWLDW